MGHFFRCIFHTVTAVHVITIALLTRSGLTGSWEGTSFVVLIPPPWLLQSSSQTHPASLIICTTQSSDVNVSISAQLIVRNTTVLRSRCNDVSVQELQTSDMPMPSVINVTSTAGLISVQVSIDNVPSYVVPPTESLGKEYYVATWTPTKSFLSVVMIANPHAEEKSLTIRLTNRIADFAYCAVPQRDEIRICQISGSGPCCPPHEPVKGQEVPFQLGPTQFKLIWSDDVDLSGSYVNSTESVIVLAGNVPVEPQCTSCVISLLQMLPTTAWSTRYVTLPLSPPLPVSPNYNVIKVIGMSTTAVYVNSGGQPPDKVGEIYNFTGSRILLVNSSEKFMVIQYSVDTATNFSAIMLQSVESFRNEYRFVFDSLQTPDTHSTGPPTVIPPRHFLIVVVASSNVVSPRMTISNNSTNLTSADNGTTWTSSLPLNPTYDLTALTVSVVASTTSLNFGAYLMSVKDGYFLVYPLAIGKNDQDQNSSPTTAISFSTTTTFTSAMREPSVPSRSNPTTTPFTSTSNAPSPMTTQSSPLPGSTSQAAPATGPDKLAIGLGVGLSVGLFLVLLAVVLLFVWKLKVCRSKDDGRQLTGSQYESLRLPNVNDYDQLPTNTRPSTNGPELPPIRDHVVEPDSKTSDDYAMIGDPSSTTYQSPTLTTVDNVAYGTGHQTFGNTPPGNGASDYDGAALTVVDSSAYSTGNGATSPQSVTATAKPEVRRNESDYGTGGLTIFDNEAYESR